MASWICRHRLHWILLTDDADKYRSWPEVSHLYCGGHFCLRDVELVVIPLGWWQAEERAVRPRESRPHLFINEGHNIGLGRTFSLRKKGM